MSCEAFQRGEISGYVSEAASSTLFCVSEQSSILFFAYVISIVLHELAQIEMGYKQLHALQILFLTACCQYGYAKAFVLPPA